MPYRDLQSVLDAIPDGLLVLDLEGHVESLNTEACRILACSEDLARGQSLAELLGPSHRAVSLAQRALAERRATFEDDILVDRHGEPALHLDMAASPIDEVTSDVGGAVLLLRDRTLRDSLSALASERERLDSYGHIAAGIAHEVKNPLGGIRGAAELLELRAHDERAKETASMIVREVDRISGLVEELMVFARGDVLDDSPLNLHFVLDGVLDLLAHDPLCEKVDVERFYDPSIPEFYGDADRLTQVFLNLCRNALQAMEESGGALTITTRMGVDRRIVLADGRRVPAVLIAISDTGPGIAPDVLGQLATPFFTTRAKGTGLGLSVSRHWVTCHGGTLRIASQQGEGTTVRIALPLRRSALQSPADASAHTRA